MPDIVLTHYQAIELFCRIIAKFENYDPTSDPEKPGIYESVFLDTMLERYTSSNLSDNISKEIFIDAPQDNIRPDKRPKLIYDLCLAIRNSIPFIEKSSILDSCIEYINKGINDKQLLYQPAFVAPKHFSASTRLDSFYNTKWWLYHLDRRIDSKNPKTKLYGVEGITRGLLILHPFARVELKIHNLNSGESGTLDHYEGEFFMHSGDTLLSAKLTTKKLKRKDLQLTFSVGEDAVSFALGQYHNIGATSIYTGTILLTKINEPLSEDDELHPNKFFDFKDSVTLKAAVPVEAWRFFEERSRNVMRTKRGITSKIGFTGWHKEKNPDHPDYKSENKEQY